MFGKPKDSPTDSDRVTPPVQPSQRAAAAPSRTPESADDVSSISPGITIVGKIAGRGTVKIFGRIEGELHASTVLINDGAQVEGDIVADELTVGGRVKGTIHANRVKLNGSAVVEGDIFHRSLSIEENARFEGSSRREESVVDAPRVSVSRSPDQPDPQSTVAAMEVNRKHNGAPENEWHAPD
jgi:cytoskeletal protein CcmA (bactofilin family)